MMMMNRRQLARLLFLFPHAKKLFVGRCSTPLSDCMQTAQNEKVGKQVMNTPFSQKKAHDSCKKFFKRLHFS